MARKAVGKLLIAAVLAGLVVLGPGVADAGEPVKTGKYKGKTTQAAVNSAFRTIQFTVKKGKVTLTTEPSVGFQSCVSTPVFTLGGTTVSKKLSRSRDFTFAQTFFGNKIDKIHGRFTSSNEVAGFAIYHFSAQDLCGTGKSRVNFTARHK
jgi:secreted protein with Ig-like and vWFA domain